MAVHAFMSEVLGVWEGAQRSLAAGEGHKSIAEAVIRISRKFLLAS